LKNRLYLYFLSVLGMAFLLTDPAAAGQAAYSVNGHPARHIIEKGDTWYSVARKYNVVYADLRQANPAVPETLHVGDTLSLPAPAVPAKPVARDKTHVVKRGETLSSIAARYGTTVKQLVEWNHLQSKSIAAGKTLVVGHEVIAPPKAPPPSAAVRHDSVAPPAARHDSVKPALAADSGMTKQEANANREKSRETTFSKGREEITEEGVVAWIQDPELSPGKYFGLHRTAPTGTIVRVTNRMNRRIVFVKVVGRLPDTGDNGGILMKISKAAAEKLGVIDAKFQAELSWGADKP
jgi:LysM repeat protein